jgi:hypothetical protein
MSCYSGACSSFSCDVHTRLIRLPSTIRNVYMEEASIRQWRPTASTIPCTPYHLLPVLPLCTLRLIGTMLGDRCYMCDEGKVVPRRIDGLWDWVCLKCMLPLLGDDTHVNIHKKKYSFNTTSQPPWIVRELVSTLMCRDFHLWSKCMKTDAKRNDHARIQDSYITW